MLVYKIHPAIGVARVGNSPNAFFIGPEKPGEPGVEIAADGTEKPLAQYKDAGQIKRQAARFRVFEYDKHPVTGMLTLQREITANDAQIVWKVALVNRKAAFNRTVTSDIDPQVAPRPRNTDLTGAARDGLIIRDPRERTILGKNQAGVLFDQGQFLGKTVSLGELRTDPLGRLMVLGGKGESGSVPPGQPITHFANNRRWHDDVADGPVTATVMFPGQPAQNIDPAWVTVAPPDFAPGIGAIVTLYDVAFQAAIEAGFTKPAAKPSFRRHIMPVIQRAANLRFVHNFDLWKTLPRTVTDFINFAKTDASAAADRAMVFDTLMPPNIEDRLENAIIPAFLQRYFDQYKIGDFNSDLAGPLPATTIPEDLDRAALEACVGLNFFPGIEGSLNLRHTDIYAELCRIKHDAGPEVFPGFLTEIMAVPWQADFLKCQENPQTHLGWWPAQRPDIVMQSAATIPGSQTRWAKNINTHLDMVQNFATPPFVVPQNVSGATVFVAETP